MVLDLLELGELHIDLLRADVVAAGRAIRTSIYLVIAGASVLIAAAPVLLFALASWMESALQMSHASSLAIAGGSGAAISVALLLTAWHIGRTGLTKFSRSQEEFKQNFTYLKRALGADLPDDNHANNHDQSSRKENQPWKTPRNLH